MQCVNTGMNLFPRGMKLFIKTLMTHLQAHQDKLRNAVKQLQINTVECFEIEDKVFESEIIKFCAQEKLELKFIPSPMFLDSRGI